MDKKLNYFSVATMYIGVIMGAGFASGRECWQFFGIFGDNGYKGILITGLGFLLVSVMISCIAISKDTIQIFHNVNRYDFSRWLAFKSDLWITPMGWRRYYYSPNITNRFG